jgi:hypothetical protein
LDKVRALMPIPEEDDAWGKTTISDLMESCLKDKDPLPDYDETRQRFKTGGFLDFVAEDRLSPLWRLIAFQGTRLGRPVSRRPPVAQHRYPARAGRLGGLPSVPRKPAAAAA